MLNKPELILIDLDGTLVDSVLDIVVAVDKMMDELNMPQRGETKVRNWVGNGVERMVKRALTDSLDDEPEAALFDKAMPIFSRYYAEANGNFSQLFPGVSDGLAMLKDKGYKLGCVTNKAADFTIPLLKAKGIYDYFGVVVSGDTLAVKKPDPAPLLHAAKELGVNPARSTMLGDSMHDVEAARRAGFQVICVSYGYNHGHDIREANPDAVVDSFTELENLLPA
ncbi:MAG: phosphoglycolate phosphatase [Gammaproteobacteria bacterium]|nr:phosphoglycolate phosphatase [Gammaproteobacteria bacterium]